jgi:replicative DNA helicase
VSALLLRLGIVSRTHAVKVGHYRPVYMVYVSGAESQWTFLQEVGAFGPRREPATWLAETLRGGRANGNAATVPMEAVATARALQISPGRTQPAGYAELLDSPEPQESSDLFWDRIVAITAEGEEDVFDLTVPGPACWLADGVASHNSGSLEQDSDIILLIYREEVYDRNTTKKGVAEIDLVKHRNGEIGTFLLTFQGQYTRFANYVSDSYAEGVLR